MVSQPYSGHAPNYENRAHLVVATGVIALVLSTVAVGVRFWSRLVASRARFWWDDGALLATLIFSNLYLATMIWWTTIGYGKHVYMVPASSLKPIITGSHLIVAWYIAAYSFIKISALTLYGRLFRVSRRLIITLWVLGVIITLWWIVQEIVAWFNCHPFQKTVNPMLPGYCKERTAYYLALGFINFLLDIIILLLPMPVVWKLNMSIQRKILASMVFLLGYSSAFLSLTRFIMIARKPGILSSGAPGSDVTYNTVPIQIVSMLEAPLAIIALCGPPIGQIMRRAREFGWHSLFSTTRFPTPIAESASEQSGSNKSASSKGRMRSRVVRKKSSAASIPLVPTFPPKATSSIESSGRENAEMPQGSIYVKQDYEVV